MRRILITILVLALAWGGGLLVFIAHVPRLAGPPDVKADAAVVYTGTGGARIATAMAVLASGAAKRLLISGVNPETTRTSLAALWRGDMADFDCCVDLGVEAKSTEGNAREVRDWARAHGFKSLILVTSDYHMPRALLETRAQLPDVAIIAYPVESGYLGKNGRPANFAAWRQFALEYSKFLAVRLKTLAPAHA
ncbi:MAG: YdcF family protein [Alphaproteobacteria bacterium]|nr:YdcF family protein [Alphaproteobacteria bacterium]